MAFGKVEPGTPKYFALCGLGGVLSCGLTHTAVTPIDLVKCNKQNNPALFNKSMFGNMGIIAQHRGVAGLARGWAPTLVGYSFQGLGKFGLYEVFKHKITNAIGEEKVHNSAVLAPLVHMGASASAEFFADILLCPWETVKLKVQTVGINDWLVGKSNGYANGLRDGSARLVAEEGIAGAFKILGPLWGRQIPYTVIKFVAFEAIVTRLYDLAFKQTGKSKSDFNKFQQLGFTTVAGYSAGVFCGVVSHPADTMASLISKNPDMPGSIFQKMGTLYKHGYKDTAATGFAGLMSGIGPRVFMIGTLTALQWLIYDAIKTAAGLQTTGTVKEVKANDE